MYRLVALTGWLATAALLVPAGTSAQRQISPLVMAEDDAPVASRFDDIIRPIGASHDGLVAIADGGGIALSDGRAIVSYGDVVPGFGRATSFAQPVVNAHGDVAFLAGRDVTVGDVKSAILLASGGHIGVVVAAGDPSPDGTTFGGQGQGLLPGELGAIDLSLNDDGWLSFRAVTDRGWGVFLYADGALEKIAVQGDPSPDGGTYTDLEVGGAAIFRQPPFFETHSRSNRPVISSAGEVALVAQTTAGTALFAVSRGGAGRVIARRGDPLPVGGQIDRFDACLGGASLGIDGAGDVAFFADPPGVPYQGGVFLATGGQLRRIAVAGDPAPGGGTFSSFLPDCRLAIDEQGDVAFSANLSGTPGGIFLWSSGTIATMVLMNDLDPDGDAVLLDGYDDSDRFALADGAVVSFRSVSGKVLRAHADRSLTVVAGRGDPAPTRPAYRSFAFDSNGINPGGAVAFYARVAGGGVFVSDTGGVHVVASTGDPAPGGGNFERFEDAPTINPDGEVAFVGVFGPFVNDVGIFAGTPGAIRRLAVVGDSLGRTGTIVRFYRAIIDDLGQVTFLADTGKLRCVPSRTCGPLLVRAGPAGVATVSSRHPALGPDVTSAGDVAFRTSKTSLSRLLLIAGRRRKTVFRTRDGALDDDVTVNDAHEIAFTTSRTAVYPHIDFTVTFRAADGTLSDVVTVTDLAPGPDLNNAGDVLYADQIGLFRWRQGAAQAVALEGDPTSAGTLDPLSAASSWEIGDGGEVVFVGTAEDAAGERPGLFVTEP